MRITSVLTSIRDSLFLQKPLLTQTFSPRFSPSRSPPLPSTSPPCRHKFPGEATFYYFTFIADYISFVPCRRRVWLVVLSPLLPAPPPPPAGSAQVFTLVPISSSFNAFPKALERGRNVGGRRRFELSLSLRSSCWSEWGFRDCCVSAYFASLLSTHHYPHPLPPRQMRVFPLWLKFNFCPNIVRKSHSP